MRWTMLASCALLLACHADLPRLVARGAHDEARLSVERSRFVPHGRSARAYARALVEDGQVERARGVLLTDFRRGAHVDSLVALADLELAEDLVGTALVHYERAFELAPTKLRGRDDVCAALHDRGRIRLGSGEGVGADADFRMADALCEREGPVQGTDIASLRVAARRKAEQQLRSRRTLDRCAGACPGDGARLDDEAIRVALKRARATGARELRETARALRVELEPRDIVTLLRAELTGAFGTRVVGTLELQAWVGEQTLDGFATALDAVPRGVADHVRSRLEGLGLAIAPAAANDDDGVRLTHIQQWLDEQATPARSFLPLVLRGDAANAEFALIAALRPQTPPPKSGVPPDGDLVPGAEGMALEHWVTRVSIDERNVDPLLALARLRAISDAPDLGLEIETHVLRAAVAKRVPRSIARVREAALRHVVWGEPWQALVVSELAGRDVSVGPSVGPVRAAAAAAILAAAAVCAGPCSDDVDRSIVTRVRGEAWMQRTAGELRALAFEGGIAPVNDDGCPTIAEWLAADADGLVTAAMRSAMKPRRATTFATEVRMAIEADPALSCTVTKLAPLFGDPTLQLTMASLSELWSHAPRSTSARMLEAHATVALAAGHHARARASIIAATAAADDPVAMWRRHARHASALHVRDAELQALHEVLRHRPGDTVAHLELTVVAMADAARAWSVRATETGPHVLAKLVAEYLRAAGRPQRARRVEDLLRRLHAYTREADIIMDERALTLVEAALRTAGVTLERHTASLAALRSEAPLAPRSPFDVTAIAAWIDRGTLKEAPSVLRGFAGIDELTAVRRALGRTATRAATRRGMAIGLAVAGDSAARTQGVAQLFALVAYDPARRQAVLDWLLADPVAVDPSPSVRQGGAEVPSSDVSVVPVIDDEDTRLRLVLGLDLDSALGAR